MHEIAAAAGGGVSVQSYYPALNRLVAERRIVEVRVGRRRLFSLLRDGSDGRRALFGSDGASYTREQILSTKTEEGRAEAQAAGTARACTARQPTRRSDGGRWSGWPRPGCERTRGPCKRYVRGRVGALQDAIRDTGSAQLPAAERRRAEERARVLTRELQEVVHRAWACTRSISASHRRAESSPPSNSARGTSRR